MNRKTNKAKCVFIMMKNGKPYRYMSRVVINGNRIYLGCYKTEKEASDAYNSFMAYIKNNPMAIGDTA